MAIRISVGFGEDSAVTPIMENHPRLLYIPPMFRNGRWQLFVAGALCGIVVMAAVWVGWTWWKSGPERSAQDSAIYDHCLLDQHGNTVACDAMMRLIEREKTAEAAMKAQAATLLAAGFSKREVVKWAMDKGFVGSQLSDAVGISLQDLQAGKY